MAAGPGADCRAAAPDAAAGCVPFELVLTEDYGPSCAAACRVWWRAANETTAGCPVGAMAGVARSVFGLGGGVEEEEAAALAACEARWCGAGARRRRQRREEEEQRRGATEPAAVAAAVWDWDWTYVNCLERELYADRPCGMAAACGRLNGGGEGEHHKRHWLSLAGANGTSMTAGGSGGGKQGKPAQQRSPAATAVLKPEEASLRAEEGRQGGQPAPLSSAAVALAFAGGMGAAVVALGMAYLARWGLGGMMGMGGADRGNVAAGHRQRSSSVIRV